MPGTAFKDGSLHRTTRWKVLLFSLVLVVLVAGVAIMASVLLRPASAPDATRQSVGVKSLEGASTSRWNIADRAALVSAGEHTAIQARLLRKSDDASTPALTGDFDGSGGGDAKLITCAATAQEWSVSAGGTQEVTMPCNKYVKPFAVHQLKYVYIDAKQ